MGVSAWTRKITFFTSMEDIGGGYSVGSKTMKKWQIKNISRVWFPRFLIAHCSTFFARSFYVGWSVSLSIFLVSEKMAFTAPAQPPATGLPCIRPYHFYLYSLFHICTILQTPMTNVFDSSGQTRLAHPRRNQLAKTSVMNQFRRKTNADVRLSNANRCPKFHRRDPRNALRSAKSAKSAKG